MSKSLLEEFDLLVRNEPIIPFDQGMKRPFFSFNSDITNKNNNTPIRTIQKDNYSNSLSVQENRILLVDDEPDLATLFRLVLERSGFSVDVFNDPVLALSNYKTGTYFQKIRDKDKRVKVCFITAFEDYHNQFQELFPNLKVDCFIKKPIPSNQLVKIVKAKLNC
ncbi:MAG: putative signal transduction response regulator [Nitrososphaeraceae archaeon]|nr:putative signal transduction response regulator [Nitrososphaeraceae archaeon]